MARHLYLISGMGSDERVFQNLRFPDTYTVHFLPWLLPLPDESLAAYSARMAEGISHEEFSLVGVSLGGLVSLEIARQRPVQKVILISSMKKTSERPIYFNLIKKTRLLFLLGLPDWALFGKHRKVIVKFFLHAESKAEKELLTEYANRADYVYSRWAIKTLINWQNEEVPAPLVHIHGAKDLTLPYRTVQADYTIPDGGHFMVYNRAKQINEILEKELA